MTSSVVIIERKEDIDLSAVTPAAFDGESQPELEVDDNADVVKVPLSRSAFILVYIGLLLAILLAALDQTIVATALKSIVDDFGKQNLIPWIGSAYLLTAAPLGTLYGKFADIFGRKWVFVFAIVVFELGSLLCGASTSMEMLIASRAIAGIGGGGIFSLVLIIISDIVSMRDRGKFQGGIGACFGLASVIAPLLGGAFSDHVTWRWCFYINLPLGAITLATVIAFLNFPPEEGTIREKIGRIDGLGAVVLFAAVVALVTPLQLGGSIWDWNSTPTIVAKEPIVPVTIFVNSSVTAFLFISLALGAGFISAIYYISLYFQVVFDASATSAGLQIIPIVFGLVIMSITSGILVSKTGKYRHFLFIGPVVMAVGVVLVSFLDRNSSTIQQIFYLFILGLGVGSMIQVRVLGLQASVPRKLIAIATAVAQTCNSLGAAIGIAITGTIFNNVVVSNTANDAELQGFIKKLATRGISIETSEVLPLLGILDASKAFYPQGSPAAAAQYNATLALARDELVTGFNGAFKIAYLCIVPYAVAIFVAAFFVKQFSLGGGEKKEVGVSEPVVSE
ncbi:major facilitator superfamily domain-containing protein [Obelidium mucronatum]|nr:major facilitator superfamily domain-containing protein [Obelidium mucronatum]